MFYVDCYSVGSFCSSYEGDDVKHAVLVKVLHVRLNYISVPLKIWSFPSVAE